MYVQLHRVHISYTWRTLYTKHNDKVFCSVLQNIDLLLHSRWRDSVKLCMYMDYIRVHVAMAIFGRQLITIQLGIVYILVSNHHHPLGNSNQYSYYNKVYWSAKNCVSKSFTSIGLVFGLWTISFVVQKVNEFDIFFSVVVILRLLPLLQPSRKRIKSYCNELTFDNFSVYIYILCLQHIYHQ